MDSLRFLFDPDLEQPGQFLRSLVLWLGLVILTAALVALWNVWLQRRGIRLLPPRRRRHVPWSGGAILFVFAGYLFVQTFTAYALRDSGFLRRLYGPEFQESLRHAEDTTAHAVAVARLSLWTLTIAFVPQMLIAFVVLGLSGARPYQFGWTRYRWPPHVLLGFLTWLIVTPLIYAFNLAVTEGYRVWLHGPSEPHELERLAGAGALPIEWVLLFLSAAVFAPVWEELLFRGVLLSWARCRPRRADLLTYFWSFLVVVLMRGDRLAQAFRSGTRADILLEIQPLLFTAVMAVGYTGIRWSVRSSTAPAMVATALLFANVHALVWPSPVALFFLGLVLAWLAWRTQSLVASIVLHGLLNAVACVTLLLGGAGGP